MVLQTFWHSLRGSPQPFRKCCLRRLRLYLATASRNTPEAGPQNTLGTTQVQPRSTQGKPPSSIPETPKEHPRNTPGTPQEHPESTPNTAHQHSQNIPGAPKEHPKSTQERPGASQEHPGEPPEAAQKHSKSVPGTPPEMGVTPPRGTNFFLLLFNFYRTGSCNLTTQTNHFTHVLNHSFYTCVKSHAVGCHDTPPVGANCWFYL